MSEKIKRYYQNNFGKMVEHKIIVPDCIEMWCPDKDVEKLEAEIQAIKDLCDLYTDNAPWTYVMKDIKRILGFYE